MNRASAIAMYIYIFVYIYPFLCKDCVFRLLMSVEASLLLSVSKQALK